MNNITTTAGETFTYAESQALARLIFKRFGNEAGAAWRRLLENDCPVSEFMKLVDPDFWK